MALKSGKREKRHSGAHRPRTEEMFCKVAGALKTQTELDAALHVILHEIKALPAVRDCMLCLKTGQKDSFRIFRAGKKSRTLKSPPDGIAVVSAETGRTLHVRDAGVSPRYSVNTDLSVSPAARELLCVPIIIDGKSSGAIEVNGKAFDRGDVALLRVMADFAATAVRNSRHLVRIEELTITDELTGLYNAKHLGRVIDMEIRRAHRYHEEFSLVFIDLDKFKSVNDTFGHLVGSRVLTEASKLIADALRLDIDSAFRYGGDEFVVVLPKTNAAGAEVVARRIQQIIRSCRFRSDSGKRFSLTASFGIASFPHDATSRDAIIKLADEAMYEVKRKGRDGIAARRLNTKARRTRR